MQHAYEGSLPIHRVRFDAPATLTFSGYAETFAMAVTSLSVHGVGCSGPEGLVLGDRLQLAFSLAPEESPTDFPCEVIWVEPSEEGTALYGMRFVGLTAEREGRLAGLLAERGDHPTIDATAEKQNVETPQARDLDVPPDGEVKTPAETPSWDVERLATYGLEAVLDNNQRPSTHAPHRATDLDAAIAEQSRRSQIHPLNFQGSDADIAEAEWHAQYIRKSAPDRLLEAMRDKSFWLGLGGGFVLGALAVAGSLTFARGSIDDDHRATVPVPSAPEAPGP